MKGVQKLGSTKKLSLLPIAKKELHELLREIPFNSENIYQIKMYKALFLFAFHACLRAGEVVISNKKSHTLQLDQLHRNITSHNDNYIITFRSYKHSRGNETSIELNKSGKKSTCPVRALDTFLKLRGEKDGPIFIDQDKKPVTRRDFSVFLKECVELQGLDSSRYNTHSFRIGRATQLAQDNTPERTIKQTGRWNSTAYEKYIRPTQFQLPL